MAEISEMVIKTLVVLEGEQGGMEQCITGAFICWALSEEGRNSICVMAEEFSLFHATLTHMV